MTLVTTLPIEDYSPISVGDTGAVFAPLFLDGTNNTVPLTGATLTTRMTNGSIVKTWTPTNWIIDDGPGGKAHYQYLPADVDTAGVWKVQTTINIGGNVKHTDVRELVIKTPI
jgi:hypothetical protein